MSSRSSSFYNSSEQDKSQEEEFSTKEEEYDLDLIFNLVSSISEILKEIINNEQKNKNLNKGKKFKNKN